MHMMLYIHMHIHTHVHTHMHDVFSYKCTHVHTHTHTSTNTHTHTHINTHTAGGRVEHRLSDTLATQGKLSLGMFQFTAALPVDLDFVFLPGVIDPEEVWVCVCVCVLHECSNVCCCVLSCILCVGVGVA